MWVKDANDNYVNLRHAVGLYANQNGVNWNIRASLTDSNVVDLAGIFGSESDVQDAIRKLIDGIDPATY